MAQIDIYSKSNLAPSIRREWSYLDNPILTTSSNPELDSTKAVNSEWVRSFLQLYDTELDYSVNNSDRLDNQLPSFYRDRANHTGTQDVSTISDFDTEVSNNTDVAANTSARHDAVTVVDSSEIDFTLTGQQITASIMAGSIDESKLDASVNASLDLADSSVQFSDISISKNTGLLLAVDYWIDSVNGDDNNDGLGKVSAWKTLSKISAIPLSENSIVTVRVKSGIYNTAQDYVLKTSAGSNSKLNIVYEPGTIMDGTAVNSISSTNGHEFTEPNNSWTTVVFGNGLIVRNYSEPTGLSPNGFGNRNNHTLYVYDSHCDNCDDGFSCHDNARMFIYDCSAINAEKGCVLHVNNAITEHHRCYFEVSGTIATHSQESSMSAKFYDCYFYPKNTSAPLLTTSKSIYINCIIGNTTSAVKVNGSGYFSGCFINIQGDAHSFPQLKKCYGKLSIRTRDGGTCRVENCILVAPSTGTSAIIYSNYEPGAASPIIFRNNIVNTSSFMSVNSTNAGWIVDANSLFTNNILSGGATFDLDLIAADIGGTVIVSNLTGDALIGSANSINPDDYGFTLSSPAVEYGTNGTNCGFMVGELNESQAPLSSGN